jgi:hypothetical protein
MLRGGEAGILEATILNRIQQQRGLVYGTVQFTGRSSGLVLEVDIYPHARNRPCCSGCGRRGPTVRSAAAPPI